MLQMVGLRAAYVSSTETHGQQDEKGMLLTYSKASVRYEGSKLAVLRNNS